ncbi:MAG: D-cysteine desulfhydrase family protein [Candidatus Nanopelagicales bacterium]|nr:D-cysteine desulfhydrase family protein [Candidatus Nanopelagicales bacterium]
MTRRVDFAARNTPLQPIDHLAEAVGLPAGRLFVKRDDLTGLTGGGNKARKLEYLVADAISAGADTLVTSGAAQSNHIRATAAAARAQSLECVAVMSTLHEQHQPHQPEGNLILDDLFGVQVVWCGLDDRDATAAEVERELKAAGHRPYVIPLGGSNALGASGYVTAADEIEVAVPGATVVCAAGTGGTMAGLAVGLGSCDRVIGVDVAALPDLSERVLGLLGATADLVGRPAPSGQIRIDASQAAAPYGAPLLEVRDAIRLVARTTGLVLDPVYTGRAMAALISWCRTGELPDGPVVFLHSGGIPALFTQRYSRWFETPRRFGDAPLAK